MNWEKPKKALTLFKGMPRDAECTGSLYTINFRRETKLTHTKINKMHSNGTLSDNNPCPKNP